ADRGLGELPLAVEFLVGVLRPGRDRERALCPCRHRRLLPHRLMCESHTNLVPGRDDGRREGRQIGGQRGAGGDSGRGWTIAVQRWTASVQPCMAWVAASL